MTQKDNFKQICNLTTNVLGLRKGSLAYKSRRQELQIARMIAGVIARKEEGIKHLLTERLYFGYYQFLFIPFLEIKKELV